jgi:hypothetical protein
VKPFRWPILLLTLTTAALLPGLPESDAQSRCPRGVQIQQLNMQSQQTRMYQQKAVQQQQLIAKKQWEQQKQLQVTQQQRRLETQTRQAQQTKLAMQTRNTSARVPVVSQQLTPTSRKITTQVAVIRPHGPGVGRRVPTALHTTSRTVDSLLVSRRVDMVPTTRSVQTQSRSVAQRPQTLTTAQNNARTLTTQSRTVHEQTRKLNMQSVKLTMRPKTCNEQTSITVVRWNQSCIACHQKQGLPYPTAPGPKRPASPTEGVLIVKQAGPSPWAQPSRPTGVNYPLALPPMPRLPYPVAQLPALPREPILRPKVSAPLPYPWVQPRPVRPTAVVLLPERQAPWQRPDYPWTKAPETPRTPVTPDLLDPVTMPGSAPKKLAEGIATANLAARPLPTEVLERPTLPATREGLAQAQEHAAPGVVELQTSDAHSAPKVNRVRVAILSDDELQSPALPALPRSVLVLAPRPEEKLEVESLDPEFDFPPPDSFDPSSRDADRLVRAPAQGAARQPGSASAGISLDGPSRSALPRSVLGTN